MSKVCQQTTSADSYGGQEYIMNFDEEEDEMAHHGASGDSTAPDSPYIGESGIIQNNQNMASSSSSSTVSAASHSHYQTNLQLTMPPGDGMFQTAGRRNKPTMGPLMSLEQQQRAQKELWELFNKPTDWTLSKFYLIQQLQAFLIEIFRRFVTPDRPCLREAELFAFVKQHIHRLIRRNGTMYTIRDDMEKTITGTLYGSKLFEKDVMMGTWTINAEKALVWENAMLDRIEAKKPWQNRATIDIQNPITGQIAQQLVPANNMNFLNKTPVYKEATVVMTELHNPALVLGSLIDTERFIAENSSTTMPLQQQENLAGLLDTNIQINTILDNGNPQPAPTFQNTRLQRGKPTPVPKLKPPSAKANQKTNTLLGKRTHKEVIDDFESVFKTYKKQKRQNQNSLESLATPAYLSAKLEAFCRENSEPVDLGQMLKEFGSERLIGMLHAFVLLKPILSKSLRDKEEAIVKEADLSRFDRLKDFPSLTVDSNEVQERMDELHETVDEVTTAFNRTLLALQKQIAEQQQTIEKLKESGSQKEEVFDQNSDKRTDKT